MHWLFPGLQEMDLGSQVNLSSISKASECSNIRYGSKNLCTNSSILFTFIFQQQLSIILQAAFHKKDMPRTSTRLLQEHPEVEVLYAMTSVTILPF